MKWVGGDEVGCPAWQVAVLIAEPEVWSDGVVQKEVVEDDAAWNEVLELEKGEARKTTGLLPQGFYGIGLGRGNSSSIMHLCFMV